MNTTLNILYYDIRAPDCLSYEEVKDYEGSAWSIDTNCLVFFSFDYLKKFDDVIIWRENKHISLKELLENNEGQYTKKEIRPEHNALKLFLAGALEWQE